MGVKLAAASGGSIELVPTNTASNFTVTVPAGTGTMLTTASTGTVLQVVNATASTAIFSSTNTFVDTGLTASITPSSSTSKILVIADINGVGHDNTSGVVACKLVRNATGILDFESSAGWNNGAIAVNVVGSVSTNYLDSPSTTSSTTYKVQFCSGLNGARTFIMGSSGGVGASTSTITLMEIAA
jgi:hypothetical protein